MKQMFNPLPTTYQPLYHDMKIHPGDPLRSYAAASVQEVLTLHQQNIGADYIYFAAPKTKADIASVIGKCRLVANHVQELLNINDLAAEHNRPGYLETVGLRVIPAKFESNDQIGFPESHLLELVETCKKMSAISIRGAFIQGDLSTLSGQEMADYFHESYQLVKRMTTLLPCQIFYFCLSDILGAMETLTQQQPQAMEKILYAANIVGIQNQTAFYARLLVD